MRVSVRCVVIRTVLVLIAGCVANRASHAADELQFRKTRNVPAGVAGNPIMFWDPFVLREGPKVHIFFGTIFGQRQGRAHVSWNPEDPSECAFKDEELFFSIGYGFLDERQGPTIRFRPTPVIYPGKAGAWDDYYVETPSLVRKDDTYHLFYSAFPRAKAKRYQIGAATLNLGNGESLEQTLLPGEQLFKRFGKGPILPPSRTGSDFDRDNTQEPSILYRNGRFELYYLGIKATKPNSSERIDDLPLAAGSQFQEIGFGRILLDDKLGRIPSENDHQAFLSTRFEKTGIVGDLVNIPQVIFHDGRYHMFYAPLDGTGPNHKDSYIAYRSSVDGVDWSEPRRLLSKGEGQEDNWGLMAPCPSVKGEKFELVFTAWGHWSQLAPTECFKGRFRTPVGVGTDYQGCLSMSLGFAEQAE